MITKSMLPSALAFLCASSFVAAAPVDETWYQSRDSPIAALFQKRYTPSPNDANFSSNYPAGGSTPPSSSLPSSWTAKLASIAMPNVPVSLPNNGYPTYAGGEKGSDSVICSFTYACTTPEDLYNAPDGIVALAFDDGPTTYSESLYTFLTANNISNKATHFMIGGSILYNPTQMQEAAANGGHIAVHTWSHPYMTTLTNEQVLAEIGWTMQIISDLNGGRLPKFWRPPFGDVDNRVRAIAKGVFGLETVVWNQDSADWAIGHQAQYTNDSVNAMMSGWLSGPKSPGLTILEHELNPNTIGVFEHNYPLMVSNGWRVETVADAWGMDWYQNSDDNTAAVTSMAVGSDTLIANTSTIAASSSSISTSATMSNLTSASSTSSIVTTTSTTSAVTSILPSVVAAAASASASTSQKTGAATRISTNAGLGITLAGLLVTLLL